MLLGEKLMVNYKAIIFDLDDTLLDRENAVNQMFLMILEKCYEGVKHSTKNKMLQKFKEHDKRAYGYGDKTNVLESLFDEFPPKHRLPSNDIQDFWNNNFPHCFSINPDTLKIVNTLKTQVKVAIITNGLTLRQKAKIINTNLNSCFDIILISEEVGFSKPDRRIFELALKKLNVQPEETLFIGDDLEKDIGGCQSVSIKGLWFNPRMVKNDTTIKPDAEINSFERILDFLPNLNC